jgi:polyhydroxyalkanoate synthase
MPDFTTASRRSLALATDLVQTSADMPDALERLATVEVGQTPAEVVYEENKLELLHYESQTDEQHATPILIVYALINRPYILDLQPDRSVVRRLLEAGHDVYLIRWGEPSLLDAQLTLGDYVDRYIDNCVEAVREESASEQVHLLGYCMGGTMSAMYAALHPEKVRTLGLLAAGLCFDGDGGVLERWGDEAHFDPGQLAAAFGTIPAEFLAAGFDMMDPVQNYCSKYVTFAENADDEEFVENFARMERWLAEGVDVAGETYRQFIEEIYQDNALIRGECTVDGKQVDLSNIDMPVLQIVGTYDHLIPPAASTPFTDAVPSADTEIMRFDTGHVGLSVSSRAHADLWPDVADWFADRSGPDRDAVAIEIEEPAADEDESSATAAETTDETATADTPAEPPDRDDLTAITGIGPTYAERLRAAGYTSAAALADADPAALIEATGAPEARVRDWIEQAHDLA